MSGDDLDSEALTPVEAEQEAGEADEEFISIERLPAEQQRELFTQVVQQTYAGPLPPSTEYAGYGQVLADAPERILAMAESAQKHSQEVQLLALHADIDDQRRDRMEARIGQILGFIIAALALIAGALTGGWFGGIIAAVGGAGLATAFVYHIRPKSPSSPIAGNKPRLDKTED